jgi:HEPN domain-containing protein
MTRIESDDPKAWFAKAEADMLSATILIKSGAPVTDMVCYHCQQCAEKFLKGYLKSRGIKFKWVHDLEYLIELCATCDEQFNELKPIAEVLTRSAEQSRYPSEDPSPTSREAHAALRGAERIRNLIMLKAGS